MQTWQIGGRTGPMAAGAAAYGTIDSLAGEAPDAAGERGVIGEMAGEPTLSESARMPENSCGHWNDAVAVVLAHVGEVVSHEPTAPQYLHTPLMYSGVSFVTLLS